jgi:hypothetical protein
MANKERSVSFIFKVIFNVILFSLCCFFIIDRYLNRNSVWEKSRKKACYVNMRLLLGAVEMYNLDHATCIKSLIPDHYADKNSILISQKYLRNYLVRPTENCAYYSRGDLSTVDSAIFCREHGAVESIEELANMGLIKAEKEPYENSDSVPEIK